MPDNPPDQFTEADVLSILPTMKAPKQQRQRGWVQSGRSRHPLYTLWRGMIERCHNPKCKHYGRYGARGITVCQRWRYSFQSFLDDIGQRPSDQHSLDRFPNNDGPYAPENVRWATRSQQNRNTRKTRFLTVDGETMSLPNWADKIGVSNRLLLKRAYAGWTDEEIVKRPFRDTKGERNPRAKWTAADITEMHRLRNEGPTLRSIADRIGSSEGYVGEILRGKDRQ